MKQQDQIQVDQEIQFLAEKLNDTTASFDRMRRVLDSVLTAEIKPLNKEARESRLSLLDSGDTSSNLEGSQKVDNVKQCLHHKALTGDTLRDTNRRFKLLVGTQMTMEVQEAKNGKEAVYLHLAGASFDLILMDNQMPIMSGIQATEQLRKTGVKSLIVGVTSDQSEQQAFIGEIKGLMNDLNEAEKKSNDLVTDCVKQWVLDDVNPKTDSVYNFSVEIDMARNEKEAVDLMLRTGAYNLIIKDMERSAKRAEATATKELQAKTDIVGIAFCTSEYDEQKALLEAGSDSCFEIPVSVKAMATSGMSDLTSSRTLVLLGDIMDFLLTSDTKVVTSDHYSTLQGDLEKHRNAALEGNDSHYGASNGKVISSPSVDLRKSRTPQLVCVKLLSTPGKQGALSQLPLEALSQQKKASVQQALLITA